MSDWASFLESQMQQGEKLISFVEDLKYEFRFVPHVQPDQNYSPASYTSMILALTNHRIIARFWDGNVWKWFYISALNGLTERRTSQEKPNWPYQAILMIPSGIALVVQTAKVDQDQQSKLSSLLVQGFMRFGTSKDDTGSIVAIAAHEEEERQRQQQAAGEKR